MPTDGAVQHYFDHTATSWPKPAEVTDAMMRAMTEAGGNPGRSAHPLALGASRTIAASRSSLASLLGVADERAIAFTPGCTSALNIAIKGGVRRKDRVVVSSVEHNAVVRTLAFLEARGLKVVTVQADSSGRVDPDAVESAVMAAPTAAIICQHVSNVTGTIQPIGDLVDIAHDHGAVMIVDGAQSLGHIAVDLGTLGADAYAFTGHKGLLGPQGTGGLYLAPGFEPTEIVQGGGGETRTPEQPTERPDRYESGTPNTPGIAGLGAGAEIVRRTGDELRATERRLTHRLHEALSQIPGIRVLGPALGVERGSLVSVVHERLDADEMAFTLDRRYGIASRAGLHCTPWTHRTIGTIETGALRFSLGWGLTDDDVDAAIDAMREICA